MQWKLTEMGWLYRMCTEFFRAKFEVLTAQYLDVNILC